MELTALDLYLITRLDYVRQATFGLLIVLVFYTALTALCIESDKVEEKLELIKKRISKSCAIGIILFLINFLSPTTKEAAAIIVIPKIANSEMIKSASDEALDIVRLAKDWVKKELESDEK